MTAKHNIYILPPGWNDSQPNPASDDGSYKNGFSLLKIDRTINGYIMGLSPCGCFSLTLNPAADDFLYRYSDFIQYENTYNRCILIYSEELIIKEAFINSLNYNYKDARVREIDPKYAVHSTTLASYEKIIKDDCLKSPVLLAKEGIHKNTVGLIPLGEPEDYLEYVMFAPVEGWGSSSEMVVNSHLRGKVCFDPNSEYTPQARMYFNAHKIIKDSLAVRDGIHILKVYESLKLSEYIILTVFEGDVILPAGCAYWTPTLFTEAANEYFFNRIKEMGESCFV